MADLLSKETAAALVLGLVIGGGGGVAIDPIKGEQIADISVAEYVAGKSDSLTKIEQATDAIRPAGISQVMHIDDGDTSYEAVEYPAAVERPEKTIRVDVPDDLIGQDILITATVGDGKILGVTKLTCTQPAQDGKALRLTVETMLQDVVR